jgi:hypothetical protein
MADRQAKPGDPPLPGRKVALHIISHGKTSFFVIRNAVKKSQVITNSKFLVALRMTFPG